jgi:hypothetical protein
VSWWVNITSEVIEGVKSFGFTDPSAEEILDFVAHYLSEHGEDSAGQRWHQCPDDFFVYTHILIDAGCVHTLEFIVDDTSAEVSVLNVVWVEHHPGKPV